MSLKTTDNNDDELLTDTANTFSYHRILESQLHIFLKKNTLNLTYCVGAKDLFSSKTVETRSSHVDDVFRYGEENDQEVTFKCTYRL